MKVYTCNDHDKHWPVGCASVVVAEDENAAQALLDDALKADGLKPHDQKPYTLTGISTEAPQAIILCNGDY